MSHSVKLVRGAFTFSLLSIFISIGVAPASAAPYDSGTKTGDVTCSGGGTFSVANGVLTGNSGCAGTATIPKEVTSIATRAFVSEALLTGVIFEPGSQLNLIGSIAFAYTGLVSIRIPSGVTSLGDFLFAYSTSLDSVVFEPGSQLTSIGSQAFKSTTRLTSIIIPTTVTSIGSFAFQDAGMPFVYTYCATGTASTAGAGLDNKTRISTCSAAPGAPTIGTATATGITTATVAFTAPASDGGETILSYTATSSPGSVTATITQAGSGTISITGLSASTSYTFTITALNSVGASLASAASNSITTSGALATGIAPLFTSASSYDGRFTVQISDYDEAFTYAATSSAGQASINSTGLITVTGLLPDQSVTVSVTTTRTGYASGSGSITGRSQVAPMLPGTKPVIQTTESTIMCTIGSYSATPTSSAFSLFVDGKHISTIFSAVGDFLPDWIIPWATSSTITRTATLTSATWSISDDYKGKSITCATLAYSKNAIGFTATKVLIAR
jgi:hypothetical protein